MKVAVGLQRDELGLVDGGRGRRPAEEPGADRLVAVGADGVSSTQQESATVHGHSTIDLDLGTQALDDPGAAAGGHSARGVDDQHAAGDRRRRGADASVEPHERLLGGGRHGQHEHQRNEEQVGVTHDGPPCVERRQIRGGA